MTRSRLYAVACAAVSAVAVAVGASGCGAAAQPAAEVAGIEYSVDDLHDYLATTDPDTEARASRETAAGWLSRWVFFSAAELELAERGIEVTDAHEAEAVQQITSEDASFMPRSPGGAIVIRQQAVALAAFEWTEREAPGTVISDPLRHLCSRHILVASAQEAAAVLGRLGAGEEFALLAGELSLDTGSAPLGGDLGCVVEGSFVAPFEDAAYAAQGGEVTVAESEFGFHLIEVVSSGHATADNHPQLDAEALARMTEDAELAAFERGQAAAEFQRQELLVEFQASIVEDYADQVRIDERYGRWDPDGFQVVLETAP